jgi:hypothetical protein
MSISRRTIVLETAACALLATGGVALASPGDPWLSGVELHPAWLAVIVPAARYGTWGLLLALGLTGAGLAAIGLLLAGSLTGLSASITSSTGLLAMTAAIGVAWIALSHESRRARLARRLDEAEEARLAAVELVAAHQEALTRLRARHDRIDLSVSLWRELAVSLDCGDEAEAGTAALELCSIRCGATGGTVHAGDRHRVVARYGAEPLAASSRHDLWFDRTVNAASELGRPVSAAEVDGATAQDSDLAVPIVDDLDGTVLGVLALRGVSPARMGAAELRDVLVIASWLAPALVRPARLERKPLLAQAVVP